MINKQLQVEWYCVLKLQCHFELWLYEAAIFIEDWTIENVNVEQKTKRNTNQQDHNIYFY